MTKSDGTKFGKSEGGAIWLDPEMTSPYAFYQFWFNTDDRDVGRYLRFFSFKSREELLSVEKEMAERPAARAGQRTLAAELTALVHGPEVADDVIAASHALFGRGALDRLMPATLQAALAEAGLHRVQGELPPAANLFRDTGLVASMNEARRAIAEGGAYINNERVTDGDAAVPRDALLHGRFLVLRRGKRTFAGVEVA
ncbi:hypothetical protein Pflav_007710 [Phytohabitans flavus]|uniref:Tyrosine--tRNA ligase n=1 Tax=Phytohabitans flavus TaxID=1076124 RepID=A0A6F8XKP5_9ACTN|nr:hypothetical protein Pflav_007710 [Phytohabitans flavus]